VIVVAEPVATPFVDGPPQAAIATPTTMSPIVVKAARRNRGRRVGSRQVSFGM
jgi:hypothetical protein